MPIRAANCNRIPLLTGDIATHPVVIGGLVATGAAIECAYMWLATDYVAHAFNGILDSDQGTVTQVAPCIAALQYSPHKKGRILKSTKRGKAAERGTMAAERVTRDIPNFRREIGKGPGNGPGNGLRLRGHHLNRPPILPSLGGRRNHRRSRSRRAGHNRGKKSDAHVGK